MVRFIPTLLGLTSVLLLSASLTLAQRSPQARPPDPPAVQEDEPARENAPPAPQMQPQEAVDDESPRESGTVIAVANDGTATVRTVSGASVQLPPGDWEVGDAVVCVTRAGTTVCGPTE